ncbi:MAG: hypothetical protein LBJ16_02965, partial [Holosporaceae bacterium]|nr:hypothetical protein [Holosporaceae bacterium]
MAGDKIGGSVDISNCISKISDRDLQKFYWDICIEIKTNYEDCNNPKYIIWTENLRKLHESMKKAMQKPIDWNWNYLGDLDTLAKGLHALGSIATCKDLYKEIIESFSQNDTGKNLLTGLLTQFTEG